MREILFRAKSSQSWCYGYVHKDYESSMSNKWRLTTSYGDVKVINPDTIGEWTGLIDKNNVMIFEGDIVKTDSDKIKQILGTDTFTIEFVCGNFYICHKGTIATVRSWGECSDESIIEVIGNIYDNPELLNKGN